MTKARKRTAQLTIRVPGKLLDAIRNVIADPETLWLSHADFIIGAAEEFMYRVQGSVAIQDLGLPSGFTVPRGNSEMMSIRIAPETIEAIDEQAPLYYHSRTKFILWAVVIKLVTEHNYIMC